MSGKRATSINGLSPDLVEHFKKNLPYFNALLNKDFGLPTTELTHEDLVKIKEAYEKAHKIREFEITLFWQRLNYLWAITAVLFAGWGYALNSLLIAPNIQKVTDVQFLSVLMISIFGMIFSVVTRFVTEGGKFWQQVWERHVVTLEPFQSGFLYGMKFGRFNPNNQETIYPSIYKAILIFQRVTHWLWAVSVMYSIYIPVNIKYPEYALLSLSLSGGVIIILNLFLVNHSASKTKSYVDLVQGPRD